MSTPLASWRESASRDAIVEFVEAVTTGPGAVPRRSASRSSTTTARCGPKPMPTQLHYIVEQWAAAGRDDPTLAAQQPYKAAVEGDYAWLGGAIDKHYAGDDSDLHTLIGLSYGPRSV